MVRIGAGDWKSPVDKFRPEDHLAGQGLLDAVEAPEWRISVKRTYARDGAAAAAARVATLRETRKQSRPDSS